MTNVPTADHQTEDRRNWWLFVSITALWTMLLTLGLAWWIEKGCYLHCLSLELAIDQTQLSRLTQIGVVWLLWAKSLLIFLPTLLLSWELYRWGWRRLAVISHLAALCLLSFWLAVDAWLQPLTGVHAIEYLPFAWRVETWQWAGNDTSYARQVLLGLGLFTAALTVVTLLAFGLARLILLRLSLTVSRRLGLTTIAGLLGVATGHLLLLTQVESQDQVALTALNSRLPISLPRLLGEMTYPQDHSPALTFAGRQISDGFGAVHPGLDRPAAEPVIADTRLPRRKHVVLIVMESLRGDVCTPEFMPELNRLAEQGLKLNRHYSGSNMSHYGMYSLLYGQSPLNYVQTLNARIPPHLCTALKSNGYQTSFITSGDCNGWLRMGEFIDARSFDRIVVLDDPAWVQRDRQTLQLVRQTLQDADRPQFVTAFLMSTHYNYEFPEEFRLYQPVAEAEHFAGGMPSMVVAREQIVNRYRNAVRFLDREVAQMIRQLDLDQTIVVVTGDHGESFLDDGRFFHGSRLSEAQTRTPMLIYGAGVSVQTIDQPTCHYDLFPMLCGLLGGSPPSGLSGRDLLREGPADRAILLVHGRFYGLNVTREDRVLALHNERRLLMLVYWKHPHVSLIGFTNDQEQLQFDLAVPDQEVQVLTERTVLELNRLAPRSPEADQAK